MQLQNIVPNLDYIIATQWVESLITNGTTAQFKIIFTYVAALCGYLKISTTYTATLPPIPWSEY